ncbi:MAG: efflux RND transporter periplasmic adaptor subunit [Deltaproteobacteria bacterium]|nr:efflux RND transporter periplasmic adaptor subunit [Deltaproteobacteria bacterium]
MIRLLLLLAACGDPSARGGGGQAPLTVGLASAEAVAWADTLEVPATLAPLEQADIAADLDGRVVAVHADLGQPVRRGEPLAAVLDEDWRLALSRAEVDRAEAERELARTEQLLASAMAAPADLDVARTRADAARTAVAQAEARLARTVIRAPWDGVVAARSVSVGDWVRAGTVAFAVVQVDPLRLQADVPEAWASQVEVGTPATVVVEGLPPVEVTVDRVGPAVVESSRTFPVEARIPNSDGGFKAGTFARVRLRVGDRPGTVAVPTRAVLTTSGFSRVFEVADGHAVERPVEVMATDGDRTVVTGVAPGAQVAVRGAARLSDGVAVVEERSGEEAKAGAPAPAHGGSGREGSPGGRP